MSQEDADDLDNDETNSQSELFEQRISTAEQHDRRDNLKKQHIELKDLTEENFMQLTESKSQNQRFYSWLNFQPLF